MVKMRFSKAAFLTMIFFVITVNNVSGQPQSSFTVDRYNVCSGTTIILSNTSAGANSFEWKIEGAHYSFQRDTIATLIEPCYDLKELRLIATDTSSNESDSSSIVVEVFDSCFFHWTGDFTLCPGDTVIQAANPEEIATQYVITPPHTLISGCLTCPSIGFVLTTSGTLVDKTSTYLGGCSETTSYHYTCNPLVVRENKIEKITIFPVPTDQTIIIESISRIKNILITNISGEILFTADDMDDRRKEVDVSGFIRGIYFVIITLETGQIIRKKIAK